MMSRKIFSISVLAVLGALTTFSSCDKKTDEATPAKIADMTGTWDVNKDISILVADGQTYIDTNIHENDTYVMYISSKQIIIKRNFEGDPDPGFDTLSYTMTASSITAINPRRLDTTTFQYTLTGSSAHLITVKESYSSELFMTKRN